MVTLVIRELYANSPFQFDFGHCQRIVAGDLGIDCAEMPNGDLLIFEADNAMIVHSMDPEGMFP
jgi:hypothetical protein